jgi:hypothetical protein
MQAIFRPRTQIEVIVRSWGDEPVRLFLYRVDNNHVYVGNSAGNRVIGLPAEQVYLFDRTTYSDLRRAFDAGDSDRLISTYSKLAKESSCNRYQDILELQHGKENITDFGSTAESGE